MPPFLGDRSWLGVAEWTDGALATHVQPMEIDREGQVWDASPYESYYLFQMDPRANGDGTNRRSELQTTDWMVKRPNYGRAMHIRSKAEANQLWEPSGATTGHATTPVSSCPPMKFPPCTHGIHPVHALFVIHTRVFLRNMETKHPRPAQDILPRIYRW